MVFSVQFWHQINWTIILLLWHSLGKQTLIKYRGTYTICLDINGSLSMELLIVNRMRYFNKKHINIVSYYLKIIMIL